MVVLQMLSNKAYLLPIYNYGVLIEPTIAYKYIVMLIVVTHTTFLCHAKIWDNDL